ncbi:MAG: hypothetical protein M1833_001573 [Piccolia ochrophora]|nr:MAG: hypothetical protein M1833_001573 [Piccolia ochrophora]
MSHLDRIPLQSARSRSSTSVSTKSRRRPLSRASTTSIPSVNTPLLEGQFTFPNHEHRRFPSEGAAMHAASILSDGQGFSLDPSMGTTAGHEGLFRQEGDLGNPGNKTEFPDADFSAFGDGDSQMLDAEGRDTPDPTAENKGVGKKKGSSTAANELELRRLFRENEHKGLHDIAAQLRGDDQGAQSEKTRQVFAMLWLNTACQRSTGSIPRNRVYGHYVSRCGTDRVTVLNPASFGKLVRVMYPGILTRRLGMRGESKYHYCNMSLVDDQHDLAGGVGDPMPGLSQRPFSGSQQATPNPNGPADTAVFPPPPVTTASNHQDMAPRHSRASSSLFTDVVPNDSGPSMQSNMVERELRFPTTHEDIFRANDPIDLPSIQAYVPVGTDPDTVATLTALYRHSCTSLVECMRFCREKQFFHLFTSFNGTLTVPVQKLLANPALAPWIRDCDWLTYQKMIRVIAPLTLQVIPKPVLEALKNISQRLCSHIKTSFHPHPAHVIEAKLGPATVFASLLDRLLRVNMAAHAAANMLCNNANRDQMYEEWILHVEPLKIVQNELPNCGYEEVWGILTTEMRGLLEPINVSWELDGGNASYQHTHTPDSASTDGVLDRWTNFLNGLPARFPGADARTIITCVNSVGTAALRDITMSGGKSFGSWWITKLWLDEMICWMAEKGGFMEYSPTGRGHARDLTVNTNFNPFPNDAPRSGPSNNSHSHSHPDSRFSSVDNDYSNSAGHHSHFDPNGPFNDINHSGSLMNDHNNEPTHDVSVDDATKHEHYDVAGGMDKDLTHDDSGVGMRLTDDDMTLGKYGFGPDDGPQLGSDPATSGGDVIVC